MIPRSVKDYDSLLGLFGHSRQERTGFLLYTEVVRAARHPYFYETLGVPDTLDGRFDLVGLYASMVIRRLRILPPKGPRVAQAVFDAMFSDMDTNLREMGVGDMSVAKKVRAMWEAFHGRAAAYEAPLAAQDGEALVSALVRNVWRGQAAPGAPVAARIVLAQMAALDALPDADVLAGRVSFVAPDDLPAAA
jgi:cytochrome b pre-mRNA-processing protein 3